MTGRLHKIAQSFAEGIASIGEGIGSMFNVEDDRSYRKKTEEYMHKAGWPFHETMQDALESDAKRLNGDCRAAMKKMGLE